MAYCLKPDIEKRFPAADLIALTDDEGDQTKVNERITQAIVDADGLMDTYFRSRHTVPIPTPGAEIKECSVILSYYNLVTRLHALEDNTGLFKLYDRKLKWLELVAKGAIKISDPDSMENTADFMKSNKTAADKVYTADYMKGFSNL